MSATTMFVVLIAVFVLGFVAVCVEIAAAARSIRGHLFDIGMDLELHLSEIRKQLPPAPEDDDDL